MTQREGPEKRSNQILDYAFNRLLLCKDINKRIWISREKETKSDNLDKLKLFNTLIVHHNFKLTFFFNQITNHISMSFEKLQITSHFHFHFTFFNVQLSHEWKRLFFIGEKQRRTYGVKSRAGDKLKDLFIKYGLTARRGPCAATDKKVKMVETQWVALCLIYRVESENYLWNFHC